MPAGNDAPIGYPGAYISTRRVVVSYPLRQSAGDYTLEASYQFDAPKLLEPQVLILG
jgi:hypothetical protein